MSMRSRVLSIVILLVSLFGAAPAAFVAAQDETEPQRYGREGSGYAGQFAEVLGQLDTFWYETLQASGMTYTRPGHAPLHTVVDTACGPAGPQAFAFYCGRDATIYYSPSGFAEHEQRFGDFAPVIVMAHEWGHHVQFLLGVVPRPGTAFELQADCLSGAYASEAGKQGLLDPGDLTEAVFTAADAGDPIGLPLDSLGAHGTSDDRIVSFMRGYLDGVSRCDLPLEIGDGPVIVDGTGEVIDLWPLLPPALALPQDRRLPLESEGVSTFADMVAGLPDPDRTPTLLQEWGWQENVYRIYSGDASLPDAASRVVVGVHRFSSVDGAAAALPYFAAARRDATGLTPVDVGLFADQTEAMSGWTAEGNQLIVYARRGNLVFRVDGISPGGDPTADVFETLLILLVPLADDPRVVSPELFALLPDAARPGAGLTLSETHARSAATIATTFPDVAGAERLFQGWGWRDSAARVFTDETAIGISRLEVSVFRLANAQAADAALPYFLSARAEALGLSETLPPPVKTDAVRAVTGPVEDGVELTVYLRRGAELYRVSAIGHGDLVPDLARVLGSW